MLAGTHEDERARQGQTKADQDDLGDRLCEVYECCCIRPQSIRRALSVFPMRNLCYRLFFLRGRWAMHRPKNGALDPGEDSLVNRAAPNMCKESSAAPALGLPAEQWNSPIVRQMDWPQFCPIVWDFDAS